MAYGLRTGHQDANGTQIWGSKMAAFHVIQFMTAYDAVVSMCYMIAAAGLADEDYGSEADASLMQGLHGRHRIMVSF